MDVDAQPPAAPQPVRDHGLTPAGITHRGLMLLGYQRTKQISRRSRLAWEAGDPAPLDAEVTARGPAVFDGAAAEIHGEYLPLRDCLRRRGRALARVVDIGCGQAITDAFLWRDFGASLTLVDIEETPDQYHAWAAAGSGYAALADAQAFLIGNGVPAASVTTINPRDADARIPASADLAMSLFSCGFHYPIADYADLFCATVEAGGAVVLDLRLRYLRRPDAALERLMALAGTQEQVFRLEKSERILFAA